MKKSVYKQSSSKRARSEESVQSEEAREIRRRAEVISKEGRKIEQDVEEQFERIREGARGTVKRFRF